MPFDRIRKKLPLLSSSHLRTVLLLGFSSGLPLALSGATLQAWMASEGVSIATIGWLTLAGVPYTWKFLWAPVMDRFALPFLGRRRGWMLATQLTLAVGMALIGLLPVSTHPAWAAIAATALAFVSASQDIIVDAYRTDLLTTAERGPGAGLTVLGYRLAMLCSGALALMLAAQWGWPATYALMGGLMGIGIAATLSGPEPPAPAALPRSLREAVLLPLQDFLARPGAWVLIALVVLYKLGDAFAGSLSTAFLIRGAGFGIAEVGAVNKGIGLMATILGAMAGGTLMVRWGLYRSLFWFGLLQGSAALAFAWLAAAGHQFNLMVFAVFLENLTSGMGTAAFTALLMALCSHRFSATQFALLSALAATGRVYVGPLAGHLVSVLGWTQFFMFSVLAALPGLWLVWRQRRLLVSL
ncbi:MAG: MFS transporter [Betaproteobacteria bacterium]|nr:MFS transporter [Betaproteobacteria bacterium]MDE2622097.1 MFS transporter [Betaproteobacteria bacterium]